MKRLITILFFAVFVPFVTQAKALYEAEKNAQKTFSATEKNTLAIENKYGNVNIVAWDKNEVNINVLIKGTSPSSQAEAERQRDRITIVFSQSGDRIIAKTEIADTKSNSKGGFDISYEVKVPRNIAFDLANKYGNITIDECGGIAAVDVKYGNFSCPLLKKSNSALTLGYGNADIQKANGLKAEIKYSSMKMGEVNELQIDSKYSQVSLDKVSMLNAVSKYDDYKIKQEVASMTIDTKYTDIKVGKVSKLVTIKNEYGKVAISEVAPGAESLSIDLRYTDLLLNINSKICYSLEAFTSYGKTILPKGVKADITTDESSKNSSTIKGTVGAGTPTMKVKITNKYADNKLTAK